MKKFLLLIAILGGVMFFGGYQKTYAASCPNVFGAYLCSDTNVCTNPSGTCQCNGQTINDGVVCSTAIDPTADGITGSVSNGLVCSDANGCYCGGGTNWIAKGVTCVVVSTDLVPPVLTAGSVSVVNNVANYSYSSSEGNVHISCLGSCGSCSVTANTGVNTVSFTLANGTYGNCSLLGQDVAGNVSSPLAISSFVVNYLPGGGSTSNGGGGGGGGMPSCFTSDLVCTNNIYVAKAGAYCYGGNLGKSCGTSSTTTVTTGALLNIISTIDGLSLTGFTSLIEKIKNTTTYSQVKEYTIQGVKVKFYIPKYSNPLIKGAILSLTTSLTKAINKKLLAVSDPSYMIENYENLGVDMKIIAYRDIGAMTKLYNDFLATLYMVLDMGKKNMLPLAKYYLQTYLTEYIKFIK